MRNTHYITSIAVLLSTTILAQRDDVHKMEVMLDRKETSMTVGRVRYDLVGAEHPDVADPETLLLRVARASELGWDIRVYGHEGILLMTGAYSDSALTIAEGPFTFYYKNGLVESSGDFHMGAKRGLWKRYNQRGEVLNDRNYNEQENEVMKICGWTYSCRP